MLFELRSSESRKKLRFLEVVSIVFSIDILTKTSLIHVLFFVLIGLPAAGHAIEIQIKGTYSGIVEDAILIASTNGQCPYEAIALGDIDLSKRDHVFDIALNPDFNNWWLIGHINGDVVYVSNVNMSGVDMYSFQPFDVANAEIIWPPSVINTDLSNYISKTIQFSFGVMADTHYYSEPLGTPHPIQQAEPDKYDLPGNLDKMGSAIDQFSLEGVSFATILGDMVEDHKSYPTIDTYIGNGALVTNMDALQSLFDLYTLPIHLVIGNHDHGSGTSRADLYNNLTYYGQEAYDNNDIANRLDYTFDIDNIRFIVYDNVSKLPNANKGFRSASLETQDFLQRELAKVGSGGIDEGMPVVIMAHARVDCLEVNECSQKVDLTSGNYQWTPSAGGINEYYLELTGGGDPALEATEHFNRFLWINDIGMPHGDIGTLGPGKWNYGINPADPIAFDTVYVRLDTTVGANSWDPDNAISGYLQYKYVVPGAAENFEEILEIFDNAVASGSNIIGVLQGHNHINDYNNVNGIDYFSFKSLKVVPNAYAIVDVLHDNSLYVRGFGDQATYKVKVPYRQYYACLSNDAAAFSELWARIIENHNSHNVVNRDTGKLWRFSSLSGMESGALSVDLHSAGTVYEDAEDGGIDGWSLFDNIPSGATITNVFDQDIQSNVIELSGAGWTNGYELKNSDSTEWNNTNNFIIDWKMKYGETYILVIKVNTNVGSRYLRYTPVDTDGLGDDLTINIGLGSTTNNGQWQRFVRDLKADLNLAQPGVRILSVNSLRMRGSGRFDDVKLHSYFPPVDSDGDSISDIDETTIYGTSPTQIDSDGDGILDIGELNYWGANWNTDYDSDGLNNLIDADSDGDGFLDGVEVASGSDPSDAASLPAMVYEDAEDGTTARWDVFDADPAGATITNVFDPDRQSRVIEFIGTNWTNGYRLRKSDFSDWDNASQFFVKWSMKYNEPYIVIFKVKTSLGTRYLRYEAVDSHGLGTDRTVYLGLGSNSKDGQWRTYIRDLQADLALAQPGVVIQKVDHMLIRGSGRIDDVELHSLMPIIIDTDTDTDGDGISDTDETGIYNTSPVLMDTDGDDINDGDELTYWGNNWNTDYDSDGLNNLIDADSDGDGFLDGVEVASGSDPSDAASLPAMVYEDAEDGTTAGWDVFDADPAGATITNVFDPDRQSRVIEFIGTNWTNGYRLRKSDFSDWDNASQFFVKWSMKYNEPYIVIFKVKTSLGTRYLRYEAVDSHGLGTDRTVYLGLGSNSKDGQWRTYIRDLQADLALAQPDVVIQKVDHMLIRGSGRIDDIELRN